MRTPAATRRAAVALMKAAPLLDASQTEERWGALIRSCPSGPRRGEPWLPLLMELAQGLTDPRAGMPAMPVAIRVLKEAGLPLDTPNGDGRNAMDLALKKALSCVRGDMSALMPWVEVLMNLTRHGVRQTAESGLLATALQEGYMAILVHVLLESGSDPNAPYAPGRSCFQEVLAHQPGYLTAVPLRSWIKAGVNAADPEVRQRTAERLVEMMEKTHGGLSVGVQLEALGELLSWGQVDWHATVHPLVPGWPCKPLFERVTEVMDHVSPEDRLNHTAALATLQARLLEAGVSAPDFAADTLVQRRLRL